VRRPTIVIGSADDDGADAKGSGRSLPGVDLGSAVAAAAGAGVLTAGGGHAMAAGMSLSFDRIDALRAFLADRLSDAVDQATRSDRLLLDGLISLSAATPETLDWIEATGPYGAGWPEPLFALSDVRVTWAAVAGGAHVRFTVSDAAGASLRGIAFRAVGTPLGDLLTAGRSAPIHMAVRLKRDTWNGRNGVDLEAVDAATAGDR
jgi:single-stranded-DNA-specific exonuclease